MGFFTTDTLVIWGRICVIGSFFFFLLRLYASTTALLLFLPQDAGVFVFLVTNVSESESEVDAGRLFEGEPETLLGPGSVRGD